MSTPHSRIPPQDRPYFAAFLNLRGQAGVVVGGGPIAAVKAESLLRSGVRVTVVAPQLDTRLAELAVLGVVRHLNKRFEPGDLIGARIVIAATDDEAVNESVAAAGNALHLPVNVADNAALSSFIMPAVVDRAPLTIAISSSGTSPVIARRIRALIETAVPRSLATLAELAGRFRARSREKLPDARLRRRFWEDVLDGPIAQMVESGREAAAAEAIEEALEQGGATTAQRGMVYLVGGGPGNPELLTLRALQVLHKADVVLYDNLVTPAIVDLARREAERIYVGKRRDVHTLRQEEINALMVKLATEGKRVVRLKGGDPFIFGRGGEEIETLADSGIAFEVVPGITAASGIAAYAGIPLTHRDWAQSCVFVTGHLRDGTIDLDWEQLARPRQTVVVYMGVRGLASLCEQLVAHGLAAETPAAMVEWATLSRQRVVTGPLMDLAERVTSADIHAPATLIVGEVVRLRDKLGWFAPERRPESPTRG